MLVFERTLDLLTINDEFGKMFNKFAGNVNRTNIRLSFNIFKRIVHIDDIISQLINEELLI